jgi:hypothetical protein
VRCVSSDKSPAKKSAREGGPKRKVARAIYTDRPQVLDFSTEIAFRFLEQQKYTHEKINWWMLLKLKSHCKD